MSDQTYVELKHINKTYGDFQASTDINLSIPKGKLVALLGPSGSGKTTILKMLAGLEQPDSGEIYIDGKEVSHVKASERGIGFVFQNYALFRYMTVYDNIAFGLKIAKWDKKKIDARVKELIELVGLSGMEKRYPRQLSGGQRQRVAFARAIATEPRLLLLDEPFAAIDAKVRKELRSWLKELIREVGITSIFVTHDQEEATEVADEIIITNAGRVEQVGSPLEIYNDPKTPFTAGFLGETKKIQNYREFKGFEHIDYGEEAIVRPEYVTVYKKGERVQYKASTEKGIVEDVIFRGSTLEVHVSLHGEQVISYRQIGQAVVAEGEEVEIFLHKLNIIEGNQVKTIYNELYDRKESLVI